ncbi:uncharacterized protein [Chamaea fasciata]|uniref:uncharacterized protein n=1 Tax=Chamaea fasciata TaxID=190680 RepID=UPI00336AB6C1
MGPRALGGFCLALLCSGAALGFQEEEPGDVTEVTPEVTPGPPGQAREVATGSEVTTGTEVTTRSEVTTSSEVTTGTEATTGSKVTSSHPWRGDTEVTPAGNRTRTSPGVPARFWSPVLFVLLALLVLFVTYHRTRDRGIRDLVTSGSDSSDLGALVQPHVHEPVPKTPKTPKTLKSRTLQSEGKDPETPPGPELTETCFGHRPQNSDPTDAETSAAETPNPVNP